MITIATDEKHAKVADFKIKVWDELRAIEIAIDQFNKEGSDTFTMSDELKGFYAKSIQMSVDTTDDVDGLSRQFDELVLNEWRELEELIERRIV